jgi:hypothetical protein
MARATLIALHVAAILVGVYGGIQLFDLVTK